MSDTTARKPVKPNSSAKYIIIAIVIFILLIVVGSSVFVLYEGESALVQRFGRIESVYMREVTPEVRAQLESQGVSVVTGTGLRFRIPFIDNVIKYPAKLILYDSPPREVLTLDRLRLYFDNTAVWRIENPLLFYEAFNTIDRAKMRIDDVLYSEMRIAVGRLNSYVLISDRETSSRMLREMATAVNSNFSGQGNFYKFLIHMFLKATSSP